jgi:hypothetical protein
MQTTNEVDYSRGLHGGKSWVRKHPATPPGVNIKAHRKLADRQAGHTKAIQYLNVHCPAGARCLEANKPGSLNRRNH